MHARCAQLSPNDVLTLNKHWTCIECLAGILPFVNAPIPSTQLDNIPPQKMKPLPCTVCSKLGNRNKMQLCWLCDNLVHINCSLNSLGCKKCCNSIFPGNIVDDGNRKITTNLENIFNPYSNHHSATYVAEYSKELFDKDAWKGPAHLLETCKYTPSSRLKVKLNKQAQILSANIRSLTKNIDCIRDNLDFYNRFDILCFNETNCNPNSLPFAGKELTLEGFNEPILQKPVCGL